MPETFAARLARIQANHYRALADVLTEHKPVDQRSFSLAVEHIVARTAITPELIGGGLGVSKSAVERWVARQSLPHEAIREKVIEWLIRDLNRRAAEAVTEAERKNFAARQAPQSAAH